MLKPEGLWIIQQIELVNYIFLFINQLEMREPTVIHDLLSLSLEKGRNPGLTQ